MLIARNMPMNATNSQRRRQRRGADARKAIRPGTNAPLHAKVLRRLAAAGKNELPLLRFLIAFTLLLTAVYAAAVSPIFERHILTPITAYYAHIAGHFLSMFIGDIAVSGSTIVCSKFAIDILHGCDAVEPTALFLSAIIAFPRYARAKLYGAVAGVAILLCVNLARVISLFLMGIWFPSAFDFVHIEVWQFLFIALAIALFALWIQWAGQRNLRDRHGKDQTGASIP